MRPLINRFHANSAAAGFVLVGLMLSASSVRADAVEFQIRNQVMAGQDKIAIIVTANETIAKVELKLEAKGVAPIRVNYGRIKAGRSHDLSFTLPVGVWQLNGEIRVMLPLGNRWLEMPLSFEAEVVGEFGVDVKRENVHLDKNSLELTLTRSAGFCNYAIYRDIGAPDSGRSEFSGESPGDLLTVDWMAGAPGSSILKISLECYDSGGVFNTGIELFPWQLSIPHEDVNFESGSDAIPADESTKLKDAKVELDRAVSRYGQWLKGIKLFVAGHTDTVGSAASNRSLSLRRARSIAARFRKLGVRLPIEVVGLGEDSLLVSTPDEAPQILNRRAEYIVAVNQPFAGNWQRVH